MMIEIDNIIVSTELFTTRFVCDLNACKGACCVLGDAGAPVEPEERERIDEVIQKVEPYMTPEGIKAVGEQGTCVREGEKEWVTPLVENKECAYVVFNKDGIAKCAFEQAYLEGKTNFRKPESCHLYPIRVSKLGESLALNYHEWEICQPACSCGGKLGVKTYIFLKDAIVRKFGKDFFQKMQEADKLLNS